MEKLHKEGILKVAGPFGKNDFTWRGLFILDCASREAEKHVKTDPSVAAGVFIYDIVPATAQSKIKNSQVNVFFQMAITPATPYWKNETLLLL